MKLACGAGGIIEKLMRCSRSSFVAISKKMDLDPNEKKGRRKKKFQECLDLISNQHDDTHRTVITYECKVGSLFELERHPDVIDLMEACHRYDHNRNILQFSVLFCEAASYFECRNYHVAYEKFNELKYPNEDIRKKCKYYMDKIHAEIGDDLAVAHKIKEAERTVFEMLENGKVQGCLDLIDS